MLTNSSIGRYGRFANGMFQIAALIGLAKTHGHDWTLSGPWMNWDHKERFGSTEDIDLEKYFVNPFPHADTRGFQSVSYGWGYHDTFLPQINYDLSGHFQSEKYFKHAIEGVQEQLTMTNETDHSDYTCVHIRRGDYSDDYHPRTGMEYYKSAISQTAGPILLFSDELGDAISILNEIGPANGYTPVFADYIESFRIMKRCGNFICANSSYSLMAAILAPNTDKKIICPKNWFGPAWGPGMNEEMTKDLYPEGAIVI